MKEKVLITGANGHLGKKLILASDEYDICALVRSEKAERDLMNFIEGHSIKNVEIVKGDYLNVSTMKQLVSSYRYVVHLVGIIKENKQNNFDLVHKQTTGALIQALKDSKVKKICYISILGSNENSGNTCFSSRGYAEKLFLKSAIPSLILQTPMVLGEGDNASRAILKNALSKFNFTFRKLSLEQPIYAGDVIKAIKIDINKTFTGEMSPNGIKILAGPISLTREELTQKVAKLKGVKVRVFSLPLLVGYALAGIAEILFPNPPTSKAMLEVLDHDDNVDPLPACSELDIRLTPLESMLESIVSFK